MKFLNTDIFSLIEYAKNKMLVCFGAGIGLRNFIALYPELKLEKKIRFIADNSESKCGTFFVYEESKIPIISCQELRQLDDAIIIITCRDVVGVCEQLQEYSELENIECLAACYINSITNSLQEKEREYPSVYRLTKNPKIPKKIHYCWFGKNPIPDQNRIWMESWKKYCPDYEIIEWNESNYDICKNRYMHEAYQRKKWGFVPDYARLDIIYEHGGIYLDTDVELVKPLEDLLYQSAFAGIDGSKLVSLGLGFGAEKGNPFIKELRDAYDSMQFVLEDGQFNLTPAPRLQQEQFKKYGYICNGNYQTVKGMTVYPEKVLSGKCSYTGRIEITDHTYSIHHYDGSWLADDVRNALRKRALFFEMM